MTTPQILRTKNKGCFQVIKSSAWGRYLEKVDDPEGVEASEEQLSKFHLNQDFPKLPKELWAAIISLYFEMCDPNNKTVDTTSEVSVVFLRKSDDLSQWRVLVPTQEVGSTAVSAKFEKLCDIITGEEITQFPPEGWVHAGSSHSHNTMSAYFSKTDDDNELSVPGMHIVVGDIDIKEKKYKLEPSIVLRGKRFKVDPEDVVDLTAAPVPFHQKVRRYISKKSYGSSNYSSNNYSGTSYYDKKKAVYDEETYAYLLREDFTLDMLEMPAIPSETSSSNTATATAESKTETQRVAQVTTTTAEPEPKSEPAPMKKEVEPTFFVAAAEAKLSRSDRRKIHLVRNLLAELTGTEECQEILQNLFKYHNLDKTTAPMYCGD